jgi:hypothetical protein
MTQSQSGSSAGAEISVDPEAASTTAMDAEGLEVQVIGASLAAQGGVTATVPYLLWGDILRVKPVQ